MHLYAESQLKLRGQIEQKATTALSVLVNYLCLLIIYLK